MGRKRYFSLEEANAMIPEIDRVMRRLLQLNAELKATHRRLQDKDAVPSELEFSLAPPGADDETIDLLTTFKALLVGLQDEIDQLADSGCLVKHIEHGLIDWYYRKDDRDVLLCWKLGEKSVMYWHELDAGFQGRQPVSEL